MALSANTVFEVRLTGSDTNGGGFVTGASGTDWSQQDTAQYAASDGQSFGTTNFDSASATFGTDVVGNLIYIQGGTGSIVAAWYQIISRTSATRIVLDRSTGLTTGTGATFRVGGALASPGQAGAIATVAGHTVFIKYNVSPYIATTASTNVSGGCVSGVSNTFWIGYDASRTKYPAPGGNRPTFQLNSGVSSAVLFAGTNNPYWLQNIILDCNNQATSRGGFMSGEYYYVKGMNGIWNTIGGCLQDNSVGRAILCEVSNCTLTGGAAALKMTGAAWFCVVHDNSQASGTSAVSVDNATNCIAYNNTGGAGFNSLRMGLNCVAYGNGQGGFAPGNGGGTYINCIAEDNGTYGWAGNTSRYTLIKCASYNNTSGRSSAGTGAVFDIDAITSSASVFTNAAAADFTLNNTAGAGDDLRGVGFPTTFPV